MDNFTLAASDAWLLAKQQRAGAEFEVRRLMVALEAAERRLARFRAIELDHVREASNACDD